MLLVKNMPLGSGQTDIQAIWPDHELVIPTRFHEDNVGIREQNVWFILGLFQLFEATGNKNKVLQMPYPCKPR